jgi:monoamine oxidase
LGIYGGSLHIIALKSFYWPIGTHYYKPLNLALYKDRDEFIDIAQHPEKGILVVGEVVSKNQGWTEGALDSVKEVLTKKWVNTLC